MTVSQHEFDALVSFHLNTGGIGRAQLTKSLNAGNRQAAADQFLGWSKPPEIIPRRKREQALFRTGHYPHGGLANLYPADDQGRVLWSRGRRVNLRNVVPAIYGANQADDQADKYRNKTAGAGAAGVGTEATSQSADTILPDLPADPETLQLVLTAGAVALVFVAGVYAVRWWRGRRNARVKAAFAADLLEGQMDRARPVEPDDIAASGPIRVEGGER